MSTQFDSQFEIRKSATLAALATYQNLARKDTEQLQQSLDKQVKEVLTYCFNNLTWYRDRFGKDFPEKVASRPLQEVLQDIPIMTKKDVQTSGNFLKVWIHGSRLDDYQSSSTSGSTGQPVSVLKHWPEYYTRHMAVRLLDADWQKSDLSKGFFSISQNKPAGVFDSYGEPYSYLGRTGPTTLVNISKLTKRDLLRIAEETKARNVSVNGALLRALAGEQLADSSLKVRFDQVLSFADPVDEQLREQVKAAFGAKICNRYSADEVGFLAIQCPDNDHLHALQFHNFIEIVDERGKPCQAGEVGRVIVTSLTNPAMPLVRYELGDLARWSEPCSSGITLPVLDPVITRTRDVMTDEKGGTFVPTSGKARFLAFPEITDFQIYIFEDAIAILLETKVELRTEAIQQVVQDVQKMFRSSLPVQVQMTTSLAWLGHWKRRLFYRAATPIPKHLQIDELKGLSVVLRPAV